MGVAVKAVAATSLGTSTTKTQLTGGSIDVPAWARRLLSVTVSLYPLTPKTQISYNAKFFLESDDFAVNPFIALAPPGSANINTNTASILGPNEEYVVNCPVKGGEDLNIWGQMLLADGTAAVYMGAHLKFGTSGAKLPAFVDPLPGIQRHAKVGTWTACVASGKATGTAYTITGGKRIVEVGGIVNSITTTASKPSAGEFEFTSSALGLRPLSWINEPVGAFIGTGKPAIAQLTRVKDLDIPIASPCILTDTFNNVVGLATDYWISQVVYI